MSVVYFARQVGGVGPIKIGHTHNLRHRLYCLQLQCPVKLEIVLEIEAEESLEHRLHNEFAADRLWGEWFLPTPRLVAIMGKIRDGTFLDCDITPIPRSRAMLSDRPALDMVR